MSDTSGTGGPPYPEYPGQGQQEGQQPGSGYPPPPPGSGQPSYPPAAGYPPPPPGHDYPPQGYPGQSPPYPGQGQPTYPGQGQQGYPGGGYPPQQGYPGYPGYPGGYDERQQRTGWSGFAIAAFVVGLVVPLLGLFIAVPLGIIALVKISGSRQKGKAFAIIGMVLSVLWWVAIIGLGVILASQQSERNDAGVITKEGRIDFGDIREGDCISIPDPGGSENIDTFNLKGVPCADPHNAQAAAIIPIDSGGYPGQDTLDLQSVQPCVQAVSSLPGVQGGGFQPYRLIPTEGIWNGDSGHRVICFATKVGFTDFTGSLSD